MNRRSVLMGAARGGWRSPQFGGRLGDPMAEERKLWSGRC